MVLDWYEYYTLKSQLKIEQTNNNVSKYGNIAICELSCWLIFKFFNLIS
jgi:hypothetical protein